MAGGLRSVRAIRVAFQQAKAELARSLRKLDYRCFMGSARLRNANTNPMKMTISNVTKIAPDNTKDSKETFNVLQ